MQYPRLTSVFGLVLSAVAHAALAQSDKPSDVETSQFSWSYGVRIRIGDVTDPGETLRLRPSLGVRWGNWRLGTVDQPDYEAEYAAQRQPSLGYQLSEGRINATASLRLQNLTKGEGIESLSGGRYTLRARLTASRVIHGPWAVFGEGTVDVLRRGDGVGVSAGLGRSLLREPTWALSSSASVSWGSEAHWQSAYAEHANARRLSSGIGAVELGLSARGKMSETWGWSGTLSTRLPAGQIRRDISSRPTTSFQMGFQRYRM